MTLPAGLDRIPVTTKAELIADQQAHPPYGSALTEPLVRYTRYCQTSSTTGKPLRWVDTTESWAWMLECWKTVYRGAGVRAGDRVFFPFSFGPFLGFWAGFEAGYQMGLHCIPGGGMPTHTRLALIDSLQATVICCTPTYALRLAEISAQDWPEGHLREGPVRMRIEARGSKRGLGRAQIFEKEVLPARLFSTWGQIALDKTATEALGSVVAWRATLWRNGELLAEQKSFLW